MCCRVRSWNLLQGTHSIIQILRNVFQMILDLWFCWFQKEWRNILKRHELVWRLLMIYCSTWWLVSRILVWKRLVASGNPIKIQKNNENALKKVTNTFASAAIIWKLFVMKIELQINKQLLLFLICLYIFCKTFF